MDKLKFKKELVVSTLKKNRAEHLQITKEAQKGYREKFETLLLKRLSDLREGKKVSTEFDLDVPQSYLEEYDRSIQMLELCVDTEIALTQQEFKCYMQDNWDWAHSFLVGSSYYSNTASSKLNPSY